MPSDAQVIWDDQPGGNVEHVAQNGLTPEEVEDVLLNAAIPEDRSRSSGRPCKSGWTSSGRYIFVTWEVANDDPLIIVPVTAFDVTPP